MTSPSFDPPGTNEQDPSEPLAVDPVVSLKNHLSGLAVNAGDSLSFFREVAVDLHRRFAATVVIIQSTHWRTPIIYGWNDSLLHSLDLEVLRTLLADATSVPISCDVPLIPASALESPRALRVALADSPRRVAALIVQPRARRGAVLKQVEDLRQLQHYASATRHCMAEATALWHRCGDSHSMGQATCSESQMAAQRMLRSFHHSLDLSETCYRIANESRRLIHFDRVTLLVPRRSRYQVRSVSGVAVVDRRGNHIRAVESLANAAVILDQKLVVPSDEPIPPQLQEPLDWYLDQSGVSSAILIPIHLPDQATRGDADKGRDSLKSVRRRPLGILVLETFSGSMPDESDGRLDIVTNEAAVALRNAMEHQSVFGLKLWKALGKVKRSVCMPWWVAAVVIAIALLAAGFLFRVEHYVVATGTAEPETRRELFAAIDGSVQQIHVHDGQRVSKGDLLIQLENPELENRAEALAGQIQTAIGRLASIQAVRLSAKGQEDQLDRMVIEQHQLESELANLREQQQILKLQLANLSVCSPIDGTVVAWQIERRLTGRPVSRGNQLCSVVTPDRAWQLRLTVPEQNAGPILEAAQEQGTLPIRFAVATMPEQTFHAQLDSYSLAARMNESGTRVVDLIARVNDPPQEPLGNDLGRTSLRVGADVTAKIECGDRMLVHSWFSDIVDFVQRKILFRFR